MRRPAVRLHTDVRIMFQHPFGNMTRNVHDRLVTCFAGFGQSGDECVSVIVPAALDASSLSDLPPHGLKTGAGLRRISWLRLARREHEPLRLQFREFLQVPCGIGPHDFQGERVERDRSAAAGVGFRFADGKVCLAKMDAAPLKFADLFVSEAAVQRQNKAG